MNTGLDKPYLNIDEMPLIVPGSVFGLGQRSQRVTLSVEMASVKTTLGKLTFCLKALTSESIPSAADPVDEYWQTMGALVAALLYDSGWSVRADFRYSHKTTPEKASARIYWPALLKAPLGYVLSELSNALLTSSTDEKLLQNVGDIQDRLRSDYPLDHSVNFRYLFEAAEAMRIPARYLRNRLVLGTASKSKSFASTLTSDTSHMATLTAADKADTATILKAYGLPAVDHKTVSSGQDAIEVANLFGYPVVIKPANRERGEGVAAGLLSDAQVRRAYEAAREVSSHVLVERFVPGATHRLMVVNGKVIRVVRRKPGGVVGDGVMSVRELVQARQDEGTAQDGSLHRSSAKGKLLLDPEAMELLAEQNQSPDSVPPKDLFIRLRRTDNVNRGGTNENLDFSSPSVVHPDNLQLAIDATAAVGLDVGGVDLIAEDISKSWHMSAARICEVNVAPQMSGRGHPERYKQLLTSVFPNGWSVPVNLYVIPQDMAVFQKTCAALIAQPGNNEEGAGLSSYTGLHVAGRRVSTTFANNLDAASALFLRKDVSKCVCIMTPAEIVRLGFPLVPIDSIQQSPTEQFSQQEQRLLEKVRKWYGLEKQYYTAAL